MLRFCGAHLPTDSLGTAGFNPEVKRPGREVHHSSHLVQRLKICGAIPSVLHVPSWSAQVYLYMIKRIKLRIKKTASTAQGDDHAK